MFSDPSSSDLPSGADPALAEAFGSIRALAADRFEVFGPLGRDSAGEFAFLAREIFADRLVVLKQRRSELQVIQRLDSSVPPPAGACPVCQTPFSGWDPACPDCGADLAGSIEVAGLAAVREAAVGYEVLGDMARAAGGANVYFARESKGGSIVALRLEQEGDGGRRAGFTVAATRMMRPKLLYGTVGGEARPAPPWTPVPTAPSSLTGNAAGERVCPQCGETFGPELRFCPRDGSGLRGRAPSEDLIGQVVAERYHILSKLGEGGMGRVYLAEHVRMGRRCAVKVMNPMLLYDPDSVSRFNREAANASRITHPNVAAIYDFGETDDLVYLAMEFVEGESLGALLEREHRLPERRTIEIGRQVADGLSAAHELGIVHRDLKPDNVMLTRSRSGRDVVKVVDFGIAKATQGGKQTVTRTGFVVGTPAYMSPEQILGDALDPRSDIYSLGCILYETLTGERAFADSSGEISIRQRLTEPPPPPRRVNQGLSRQLDALVTTAMARAPDQRFQSAAQLSEALTAAAADLGTTKSWRDLLPWRRARQAAPEPSRTTAPAPISGRLPSGPAAQPEFTAPVPVGWTDAVQPPVQQPVRRGTTVLRHRSARPPAWNVGAIAGGSAVALLVAFGAWRLLSLAPRSDDRNAGDAIVLPGPDAPLPTAGPPAVDTTHPPGPVPPEVPAAGTVWFAEALPFDARVTVDGEAVAVAAGGLLSVAPGAHTFRVEAPGFRPAARSAQIAAGETDTLRIQLTEMPAAPVARAPAEPAAAAPEPAPEPRRAPPQTSGTVLVTGSLPPDAEISVDGRALPAGDREIALSPGSHWLKLSAPDYRPDSVALEVKPGAEVQWEAPHLTPQERPAAAIEVLIATADTTIKLGGSVQLEVAVRDEAGTYLDRRVSWESGNPAVASVEREGRLTARGPGRAYVRAYVGNAFDSMLVTVPAPPKPVVVAPRPAAPAGPPPPAKPVVPPTPSAGDIATAAAACTAAFGSGNERQIVETYQAKTARDVTNLRKVLDVALKPEARLAAEKVALGAAPPGVAQSVEVPFELRFTWRNNAGLNKKKEAAFRLELAKSTSGWKLASCKTSEKLNF